MAIENIIQIPVNVMALIQALGGLLAIYVAFVIINFFRIRKQNKMITEMHHDIKMIKSKLDKRK
ncbi:hypothetical protein HY448_02565 [Candidatus Pacearchaeota archaeon]|nr:hypothetical protein [Candidatus Pacearchaeota archaeon]